MIDPNLLIDRTAAGVPAPWWFVQFFKALGFTLHMVPMNLWYAGLLIALLLHLRGSEQGRHFARRLLQQMPILVALGVNFGIVPLLFIQLAYYKVFYPATILMAWFWLAIIVLLIPAYYGVYAYAWGLRSRGGATPPSEIAGSQRLPEGAEVFNSAPGAVSSRLLSGDGDGLALWRKAAGWLAAVLFLCIGFLFANGLSLMDHVGRWPELFAAHNVAGAATGTALNVGDPTLWPRWLLMFGLAFETTAVWVLVDAVFLTRGTTDERYQQWAWGFARKLYTVGMIWAAAAGSWYVFGTWTTDLRATMFQWPLVVLTVATAVAPGLPWLLMMTAGLCSAKRATVAAVALCQFGVLAVNAVSRQIVQNVNLGEFFSVSTQRTDVQWSPLAMFLIVFVIGLGVVGWMIAQVLRCEPKKG
jgi:hypothetical protein